ncbi:DUF485 domain-containing protein [Desulfurispirillum indicum]|nr:DUF485 domain-containing protein [Desulfurispirillum indicum]UCZ57738.1 DUF485 domain-containing protein [Desulfurispirillum indicum]
MDTKVVNAIYDNPRFQEMVKRRNAFVWRLTGTMLGVYGFFLLGLAFFPAIYAYPVPFLRYQVIPMGIPIAIGVIVVAFVLTGVYVRRANAVYDTLNEEVRKAVMEAEAQRKEHSGESL